MCRFSFGAEYKLQLGPVLFVYRLHGKKFEYNKHRNTNRYKHWNEVYKDEFVVAVE